jgi:hypothetical protein
VGCLRGNVCAPANPAVRPSCEGIPREPRWRPYPRAPASRPRHSSARGADSFQGRAVIGAARAPPAKSAGSAHARAVANSSCASASSHHAAAPRPCLVALTTSGRTEGTAHRPLRAPALSRAVCSAFEMKPGREEGWRRVDYPDSRILSEMVCGC